MYSHDIIDSFHQLNNLPLIITPGKAWSEVVIYCNYANIIDKFTENVNQESWLISAQHFAWTMEDG